MGEVGSGGGAGWAAVILALVTVQRVSELWLARRNTARLKAIGAYEVAAGHYPPMVAVHSAWLLGLWALAWNAPAVALPWLAVYLLLQAARAWVLLTLGRRWTTRILILPGERLVAAGPYRFVRHPNYLVVIGEVAVLPLVFDLPLFTLVFTALNGAVLAVRIRAENRALASVAS